MEAGPMVLKLTVSPSTDDFVKKIRYKMRSKLIGVATKLLPPFFIIDNSVQPKRDYNLILNANYKEFSFFCVKAYLSIYKGYVIA